jgi:hypothetical protein
LLFFSSSLAESSHGGYHGKDEGMKPLDQQSQFFGELGFPVKRETEAWKEKVRYICSVTSVAQPVKVTMSNFTMEYQNYI